MTQDVVEAQSRFVSWLDGQVAAEGRGDGESVLDADPSGVYWLGRLAPESEVAAVRRERRMDPCAVGLRVRPEHSGPWTLRVRVRALAWNRARGSEERGEKWEKTAPIDTVVCVDVPVGAAGAVAFGGQQIADALDAAGATGSRAEVRVTDESWRGAPELVVELVNTTPEGPRQRGERHLFEVELRVLDLQTVPFLLESLPDSFRYDRRMPAIGINCGVAVLGPYELATTDRVVVDRCRPEYAFGLTDAAVLPLTFERLAEEPVVTLALLVEAYEAWGRDHWSSESLRRRSVEGQWKPEMLNQAQEAAAEHTAELQRLRAGVAALEKDADLCTAFQLMNRAMRSTARGRYEGWRPFQIGFVLSVLPSLGREGADWRTVETVWFATGGGKTETYLGLLVLAAFYDRLRGKLAGITAWSRFPLRMLSLQQTQRFADALAAAELVRREHAIAGEPISLGYFIGAGATPNEIPTAPTDHNPIDVDEPGMAERFQVLTVCPFCGSEEIRMKFHRGDWTLRHLCAAPQCPSDGKPLPVYVVDQEIYRFLPTVVIGTLDKAALIAMQGGMRGFVEGPAGCCSRPGHGFTYAKRAKRPTGCLVPDCPGETTPLAVKDRARFAPSFRLQDELHLLRDSLGAVDSHYESLLDALQLELTGTTPKIIASSATLTGFERQVDVLYNRPGRVFPVPGPSARESFWTRETDCLLRRFVAVWPRGVTLEWVSDRTTTILQQSVRRLLAEPAVVCTQAGVDPTHVPMLLDLYGTHVVYGNTVRDVEAARRSLGTQVPVTPLNAAQLTGQTPFDEVRETLRRLLRPETDFLDRLHVITASSMISHGVDVDRLNVMTVLGVPLTTAEFIQATARVGRAHPGLVYVIHKIGRERDAAVFAHFTPFIEQGDRFVEPIPVTRSSRRVLELTTSAAIEARRLFVHEPRSAGGRLTTVDLLRKYASQTGLSAVEEASACAAALGVDEQHHLAFADVTRQLETYFMRLENPGDGAKWPNQLLARAPMRSLRDVEAQIPVSDD
ncbi:DEAD/DEAH box helicase [Streptomyces sp. APSN-46.1]|uniref:DEAD/DEAH box helicase n=1 Tax=Streptomyces sp. APSN-46.1 TaxID=2929049 RepID=UPI001FB2B721|nr:DEAD/DEAH box helicase [Streptomyces sp. APSN-46.1]MCJ1678246.1 DEAD/DEAH box helicase [Streptomyces sp. APSN-46.1]